MISLRVPYGSDYQGFFWPASQQKRSEMMSVKKNKPDVFEATYQCRPGAKQGSIFLSSDFTYYDPPQDMAIGRASPTVMELIRHGHGVFQAWDTAFSQTNTSAYTACVTGLFVPCSHYHRGEDPTLFGPCEHHFDVMILEVWRQRVDWGGLVGAFKEQTTKWGPEISIVEKRASGISLFQSVSSAGFPIIGVEAIEGKRARAIAGVEAGSTQGWFRQHRVIFPRYAPWLVDYETELKDFTGVDDSPSDQVDSTVHLVTHAIEIGSSTTILPGPWQPERVDQLPQMAYDAEMEAQKKQITNPRGAFLSMLGDLPSMSFDPTEATCAQCKNRTNGFCAVQKRKTISFDTCAAFTKKGVSNAG